MRRALIGTATVALTIALAVTAASAQTSLVRSSAGYTYFNRAGATFDEHNADVSACHRVLRSVQYNHRTTTTNGGNLAQAGALFSDAVGNVLTMRRARAANFENCMIVHGWRLVRVTAAEGAALDAMQRPQLAAALRELVGAETPNGEVIRVFKNDMQSADTVWTGTPGDLDKTSLSMKGAGTPMEASSAEGPPPENEEPLPPMPRSARPPVWKGARSAARLGPDATLVVVSMDSNFRMASTTLRFERIGADPSRPAWVDDGLPSSFEAVLGSLGGRANETYIFEVPPGRWRITSLTQTGGLDQALYETNFCLGAPSFEVAEGEAVYAGAFHLRTGAFGPDLALEPAKTALANAPELAVRLKPARYVNGSMTPCTGTYVYAVEAPDATFEEGYALGSRAHSAPAAASESAVPPNP